MSREFTIEVSERALVRDWHERQRLQDSWRKTRSELIRRGFVVEEWVDDRRQVRVARCVPPQPKIVQASL